MHLSWINLSHRRLRLVVLRQLDSKFGCYSNPFQTRFSSHLLNRRPALSAKQSSKLNFLTKTGEMSQQDYVFATRVGFDSHPSSVGVKDAYKYPLSPKSMNDPETLGVDLKDPKNKWVKEAMEVEHEAYDKVFTTYLPSLKAVVTYYKHKESGLTVASFKTNDSRKEMCFDVTVPTFQFNDRGCTHVLEHSVLVRTQTYNTFNAFYYMVEGMYHSFLNALFYKNRTRYYFSTLNEKSFYLLADRFMDSFFRPLFLQDPEVLKQEGWHYKVTKQDDEFVNTKDWGVDVHGRHVAFSGVVYNEMKKRAFATAHDRALSVMYHNLYTNAYKYDSGGNPEDLVDLTQNELSDFYKTYYGPKTGVVYFHGPNDVHRRLDFVNEYVKKYNVGVSPDPKTGAYSHSATKTYLDQLKVKEEFREKPQFVKVNFNASNDKEDLLMVGWVLNPSLNATAKFDLDVVDKVAFEVVKYLLLDNPESEVKKKLVHSNFGTRVVGPGLDDYYTALENVSFMFGVEGVKWTKETREENAKKFEKWVFEALNEEVSKGFKKEAVEAALSKVEFRFKELDFFIKEHRTPYQPKGVTLLSFLSPWLKDGEDPVLALRFEALVAELKRRVYAEPNFKYLSELVKKHLLNNTTRVTLHLQAVESDKYEKEFNKKVKEQLEKRLKHLTKEDVDKMEEEYKKYKAEREKHQDAKDYESVANFEPSEVSKHENTAQTRVYKLAENSVSEVKKVEHDTKTVSVVTNPVDSNGLLYMDYAVALDSFTVDDLKYLNLFSEMTKEAGTDSVKAEDVKFYVDKNVGGLNFTTFFNTETNNETYDDPKKGVGFWVVRVKAVKDKSDEMVDVVHEVLKNADFSNEKKGKELVKRLVSKMQYDLTDSAHVTTFRRMASKFSVAHYADEVVNGFSQWEFLKSVVQPAAEKEWKVVEEKLKSLRSKLLNMSNLTVNLTADSETLDTFLDKYKSKAFYDKLKATFKEAQKPAEKEWVKEVVEKKLMEAREKNELLVMPLRNNFVGVGGKLFDKNDKVTGEHSVALHYLMRSYLYRKTRTAGGAYGAHVYLTNTGHVAMVSYADPNFLQTLDTYKKVPDAFAEAYNKLSDKAVKTQVVGRLATLDKEYYPEEKGFWALKSVLRGETKEYQEKYRKSVVKTTKEVFKEVENKFRKSNDWLEVVSMVNKASAETAPKEYKWVQ